MKLLWGKHARERLAQRLKGVSYNDISVDDLEPITKSVFKKFANRHPRGSQAFYKLVKESENRGLLLAYHRKYKSILVLRLLSKHDDEYKIVTIMTLRPARERF